MIEHYGPFPYILDPATSPRDSKTCGVCAHLDWLSETCKAFPQGIPDEIWRAYRGHREPYPGDGGIVFEQRVIPEPPPGGYEIPDFLKHKG